MILKDFQSQRCRFLVLKKTWSQLGNLCLFEHLLNLNACMDPKKKKKRGLKGRQERKGVNFTCALNDCIQPHVRTSRYSLIDFLPENHP